MKKVFDTNHIYRLCSIRAKAHLYSPLHGNHQNPLSWSAITTTVPNILKMVSISNKKRRAQQDLVKMTYTHVLFELPGSQVRGCCDDACMTAEIYNPSPLLHFAHFLDEVVIRSNNLTEK